MVDHCLFKSDASVSQVAAFVEGKEPRPLYMHRVGGGNLDSVPDMLDQVASEVIILAFSSETSFVVDPAVLDSIRGRSRLWVSTLWSSICGGRTDHRSMQGPDSGWGWHLDKGFNMIQTDRPRELVAYLDERDALDPVTLVVEAEDCLHGGEGFAYHDVDAVNRGGDYRPGEGVDIKATGEPGGFGLAWIRYPEWVRYAVTFPREGYYRITAEVASPYKPAGRFHLEFEGAGDTEVVEVPKTGSHSRYTSFEVASSFYFERGTYVMTFAVDEAPRNNFNVDRFVFESE
ncbi:carbohydrate-binding protein [Sulfidibacter corallicola]|uniref:Carbohydrate-binding protein n=1 Tax=Sulfidibacter corallicola TaxID=2818388 RepID=A0A8A4TMU2_SULCO|nr:carbohydrate-binding protein [Sulfidibacter corallicola]